MEHGLGRAIDREETMTVSVVFPWRPGCLWRERSFNWVRDRYAATHPSWEVVIGESPQGLFSRSAAILDGARRASGDVLVVADADVWCDPADAVERVTETGWSVPHTLIHRLSEESSDLFMGGFPLDELELDQSNRQDRKPYRGNETGTLVVLAREVLFDVPPDPRFVGWGQEDNAWGAALNTLVGKSVRLGADLVHLWHPPQERQTRVVGNPEGQALWRRYQKAARRPEAMRALLAEAA